jgi:hypothetical protein
MHRTRGGRLAPPLFPQPHTQPSVSRRFRSSLSTKKVTKARQQAWNLLNLARSHRGGLRLVPPRTRTRRSTELKLVNSILEECRIPTSAERGLRDVVRPMDPHFEEGIPELPSSVGPGALVEVRW